MFAAAATMCLMDFNIYFVIKIKLAAHYAELFLSTGVCFYLINTLCSVESDELEHN